MATNKDALFLGLDAGTSGMRAICIDRDCRVASSVGLRFADEQQARDPAGWKSMTRKILEETGRQIDLARVAGIAVDGTSGTVLLCEPDGTPLSPPGYYDQPPSHTAMDFLRGAMLDETQEPPASLGRVLDLWQTSKPPGFVVVHQADWIAGQLCGRFDISDENNALKTGYDPSTGTWAFDPTVLPFSRYALPSVFPPSSPVAQVTKAMVSDFGFSPDYQVFTGTTDGTAGFVAACGLENLEQGTAVTTLGTTLVIKSITPKRADVPTFGIYSHRLFDNWIAGGASNTGGGALLRHFTVKEMTELSEQIDPSVPTGLDYYPLVSKGERFPVNDPELEDKTRPRPDDPALFLAGLLESIARIEKRGFDLMQAYGVPAPTLIKTVGGGSRNQTWLKIRERILGAPVVAAEETEAAYGSALIALRGAGS